MYRCTECGHLFDEPKRYFVDRNCDHSEEMYSCPYCSNGDVAYEEVQLCPLCEDNYVPVNDRGQVEFCSYCKARMESKFKKVMLNNIDEIEYDYFYEWLDGKSYDDFRKED